MFSNIEELSNDIDEFKANIQENMELLQVLKKVSHDINNSKDSLANKYSLFLNDLLELNKVIETRNKELFNTNNEIMEKRQYESEKRLDSINNAINNARDNLDNKYSLFLNELLELNKKTEIKNKEIFSNNIEIIEKRQYESDQRLDAIVNSINNQQLAFDKSIVQVMERLENLQLNSMLKSINKVNLKINLIYISLGIVIIINIITMVLK